MKIFLSYASEDVALAEQIQLALVDDGHDVFWDRASLPAGGEYHSQIRESIYDCDRFVFLISPNAIDAGSYTLTELKIAQKRWRSPHGRVLPVLIAPTDWDDIPNYLKAVTVLQPVGNVPAEVATEMAGSANVRRRPGALDLGFVLSASAAVTLVSAWLLGRGADGPLNVSGVAWLSALTSSIWPGLIAAGAATLFGWLRKGRRWKFDLIGVPAASLAMLAAVFALSGDAAVVGPREFNLRIQVPGNLSQLFPDQPIPVLSMIQYAPANETRHVAYQPSEFFEAGVGLLDFGDRLEARIRPATLVSRRVEGEPSDGARICFVRGAGAQGLRPELMLSCPFGGQCQRHPDDPGWLTPCPDPAQSFFRFPRLVSPAWAQEPAVHWEVPTLETLRGMTDRERVGYTEFRIVGAPHELFGQADGFTYAVRVNGTPVYIDGWEPELLRMPLPGDSSFVLEFGLENLDFSGADAGLETIEVTLDFLQGKETIRSVVLPRFYVALRPADPATLNVDGLTFTWTGDYKRPLRENKFEVFVGSYERARTATRTKQAIDAAGLTFEGRPVLAVIRPPLGDNLRYGVVIGLEEPTGQLAFTFDEDEGAQICRWALATRSSPGMQGVIDPAAYRYEMLPRPPGHPRFIPCSQLDGTS